MRRALLVATVLAVPTLGSAQLAAGSMSFTNTDADPKASTINIPECLSAAATVQISWAPTISPGTGIITYQLYASNKDTASKTIFTSLTDVNVQCPTEADSSTTNNITVVKVGTLPTNPSLANQPLPTAQIAAALKSSTVTDPCSIGGNTVIYLCMQGQAGGTNFGTARGTITLALTSPDGTPSITSNPIPPGNNALTPSWSDTSSNATYHVIQAISAFDPGAVTSADFDPAARGTFDPRDPGFHASGYNSGDSGTIKGLQNGVQYAVRVVGYTADYNPGPPSAVAAGTPELTADFWQTYKTAGGKEVGGCSGGLGGPLALALVAGALALARRRK